MNYKVGDKVKVRKWDDMLIEFGEDGYGGINVPGLFTIEMQKFCGNTVTISKIKNDEDDNKTYYSISEDTEDSFDFTEEMFEKDDAFSGPMIFGMDCSSINRFVTNNKITPLVYIVHIPGLDTPTEFNSIDKIYERFRVRN